MVIIISKIFAAIICPFLLEIFKKYGFERDTNHQIQNSGSFTPDSAHAARLIITRREKIVTCLTLCYSLISSSLLFWARNPNHPLVLAGFVAFGVLILSVFLFMALVPYIFFDEDRVRSRGKHWVSYLSFPVRLIIYGLNAAFIFFI